MTIRVSFLNNDNTQIVVGCLVTVYVTTSIFDFFVCKYCYLASGKNKSFIFITDKLVTILFVYSDCEAWTLRKLHTVSLFGFLNTFPALIQEEDMAL